MSKQNITRASQEWYNRPDDQRYLSLAELHAATLDRANRSTVVVTPHDHFTVHGEQEPGGALTIDTDLGVTVPTHWSLTQLCSRAHIPAKLVREAATKTAGPEFAAYALNYGIRMLADRDKVGLMGVNQGHRVELAAITGPEYGRIYDHAVVAAVQHLNEDGRWHIPSASYQATNPKRATTLYASDRDVFIFMVDEKNPVEIKVEGDGIRTMYRGFIVWNSEVGKCSWGLMTFLYDFVCDNRTIWGAEEVNELLIRHTSGGPERFEREGRPALARYAEASVTKVKAQMEAATRFKVGNTDKEVADWLKRRAFTAKEADNIITSAKENEGDARTLWQIVNGGTARARSIAQTDDRIAVEKRVSGLLSAVA